MKWHINQLSSGVIEMYRFIDGGGPIIRCHPDGRIELSEVPQYGGEESEYGNFPTLNAAMAEANLWT